MSAKITEVFEDFVAKVTDGQRRPQKKFIAQMLHGIIVGGSILLSNIGRALDEPMALIQTEKRLSRNLGGGLLNDKKLRDNYLQHVSTKLTKKTVIALDFSDIAKPYSVAQEGLAPVWDGSKQTTHDRGWPTIHIEAVPPGRQQIPLLLHLFARPEPNYDGDNVEIRRAIELVKDFVPKKCLWVADRGFDGRSRFRILNNAGLEWAVRLKGDRDIIDRDGARINSKLFARSIDASYEATFTSIQKRKEIKYNVSFGFAPVSIPGMDGRYTLVVAWFQSARSGRLRTTPMMLLTNRLIRGKSAALTIIRSYLERWGVEEAERAIKGYFDLENIRVMTLQRIVRLANLAAMAQGYLGLLATAGRKWVVRLVGRLTKNFGKAPRYIFYQLQEATAKVLGAVGLARRWVSPGAATESRGQSY